MYIELYYKLLKERKKIFSRYRIHHLKNGSSSLPIWCQSRVKQATFKLRHYYPTQDFILYTHTLYLGLSSRHQYALEEVRHVKTLLPITASNIVVIALPIKSHEDTTEKKKSDFLKQVSLGSNVHSFSSFMLEFISKHILIPVHRNINILGLRRLNITFLIGFYPSLQGFGWTGPAKLLVKLLTWSEIVAFRLVWSEQYHNANHCTFPFLFWKKKKVCARFF